MASILSNNLLAPIQQSKAYCIPSYYMQHKISITKTVLLGYVHWSVYAYKDSECHDKTGALEAILVWSGRGSGDCQKAAKLCHSVRSMPILGDLGTCPPEKF